MTRRLNWWQRRKFRRAKWAKAEKDAVNEGTVEMYLNGVQLQEGSDYRCSDYSIITLSPKLSKVLRKLHRQRRKRHVIINYTYKGQTHE